MGNNYFLIFSLETRKVLDVSGTNKDEVILWESHGGDNQLWFWDGEDILRNKKYPDKALDFDVQDYERENYWGRVLMFEYHGGMNQRWVCNGNEIFCKKNPSLRLDVFQNEGKIPGMFKRHGLSNQKWFCVDQHNGVRCDSCKTIPMLGKRYKCLVCPNFDLCEDCHSLGLSSQPCNLSHKMSLISSKNPTNKHLGVECDSCSVLPIQGKRYKCLFCPELDLCEDCHSKKRPSPCQQSHSLVDYEVYIHGNHRCNGCNVFPIKGNRYHCLQCKDYDLCEVCWIGNRRPGTCNSDHGLKAVPGQWTGSKDIIVENAGSVTVASTIFLQCYDNLKQGCDYLELYVNILGSTKSFEQLSDYADSVESFFQRANDFLDVEVKRIQEILKNKLLRISELERQMKVYKTRIQENAVNIRNKQKEYERYSEQIRSLERDLSRAQESLESAKASKKKNEDARVGMIIGAFFTFGLTAAIGVPLLDQAINENNRTVSNLSNSLNNVYGKRNNAINGRTQAQKEENRFRAEVHRSQNSIGLQNISLAKSKVVFKMTEEATRNIQNGLKEVKGLHEFTKVLSDETDYVGTMGGWASLDPLILSIFKILDGFQKLELSSELNVSLIKTKAKEVDQKLKTLKKLIQTQSEQANLEDYS